MKSRIWPIGQVSNVTVLDRIVVNVIHVISKVGFIANCVFPKPPLPNGSFPSASP